MSARAIRARRHLDGHIELLEPVRLPESPVFEVIVNEPEDEPEASVPERLLLDAWDLGSTPWERADLYDEAI